jgi:hypothetical protein
LLGSNFTNENSVITIDHAYATGKTAGYQQVGGLIGDNNAYSGTITIDQTYASGLVSSANDSPGGLIGRHGSGSGSTATLSNSLWDEGSTGQAAAIGSGSSSGISSINAGNRHDTSAYAALGGAWNCGTGGICRSGDGEWVMLDGNTRPFLASEYSTTIRSAHQLQLMLLDPTARYTLVADIDAAATQGGGGSMWSSQGFVPVGNNDSKFTGTFDGQGHTVSGLTINRAGQDYAGLFGYVQNATLRNVGLLGGSAVGKQFVGALAGYIVANGGTSNISNAYATGNVTGESEVGGLVGKNEGNGSTASISNVYSTGDVSGSGYFVGGLVGDNMSSTGGLASISGAYATGRVQGKFDVGGLVGRNGVLVGNGTASISNAYATGDVSGDAVVGGLVGYNVRLQDGISTISDSYATGAVTGNGGLLGSSYFSIINNSFFAISDAAGHSINNGGASSGAWSGNSYGTGMTLVNLKKLATFSSWNIDNVGGGSSVWRIYEGDTTPQLRAFMQALTVNAGTLTGKTYDGNKASGTTAGYTTSIPGAALEGALAYSTNAKDAGTYSTADASLNVGGLYSTKYDISYGTSTLTIGKAPLTVRAHSDSKTYNGQAYAGYGIVAMDGFVNNETDAVLSGSLVNGGSSYGAVNAGSYGISLSGLSSSNYAITYVGGTLTINPALLSGNLVGMVLKTYDGSTVATLGAGNFQLTGWVGSDGAAVTKTSGYYDSANAGSGRTVSVSLGSGDYVATGATNLANYVLPTSISGNIGTVAKAPLTVRAHADGKTYDGRAYTGYGIVALDGFVNNETAAVLSGTLSNGGNSYGAVNVGTYNIALSGLSSSNYAISYVNGSLSIAPAPLTITAKNFGKTYDGLAFGGGNGVSFSGFAAGEDASVLGGVLAYGGDSQGAKNAGSYTIVPAGLSSSNYSISYVNGSLSIAPAALSVVANNLGKTYDGLVHGGVNSVSYSGFAAGEDASVLSGSLSYGGSFQGAKNAGSYTIVPSGLNSGNYAISYVNGSLVIAPAALTVMAKNHGKTYDGLAYGGGNGVSYSGFVAGENASVLGGSLVYGGSAQGAKDAGSYVIAPSGLSSSNYVLHYVDGSLTVAPAALTVTANSLAKTYDGLAYSSGNGVFYSGFVAGEEASVLGGALAYGGSAQGARNVGSYVIAPSGLSSGNYTIRYVDGRLAITPAALTVTANNASKVYDGTGYRGGNGVRYSGFMAGDDASVLSGKPAYAGSSQGAVDTGSYAIMPGGLSSENYDVSFVAGSLSISAPANSPSGAKIWQGVKPQATPPLPGGVLPERAGRNGQPFLALAPGFIALVTDEE